MPIYHITNIVHSSSGHAGCLLVHNNIAQNTGGGFSSPGYSCNLVFFFCCSAVGLEPGTDKCCHLYCPENDLDFSSFLYCSTDFLCKRQDWQQPEKTGDCFICVSGGMALCAFLSKENSYMLPAAILLVEWIFISPDIFVKILQRMKWYHWLGIIFIGGSLVAFS